MLLVAEGEELFGVSFGFVELGDFEEFEFEAGVVEGCGEFLELGEGILGGLEGGIGGETSYHELGAGVDFFEGSGGEKWGA